MSQMYIQSIVAKVRFRISVLGYSGSNRQLNGRVNITCEVKHSNGRTFMSSHFVSCKRVDRQSPQVDKYQVIQSRVEYLDCFLPSSASNSEVRYRINDKTTSGIGFSLFDASGMRSYLFSYIYIGTIIVHVNYQVYVNNKGRVDKLRAKLIMGWISFDYIYLQYSPLPQIYLSF